MKQNLKYSGVALIILIASGVMVYLEKNFWANSPLSFFSLDYLLIVPFVYSVISALGSSAKLSFGKRFFPATIVTVCYIIFSNITVPGEILGKVSGSLIGATITYLALLIFRRKA